MGSADDTLSEAGKIGAIGAFTGAAAGGIMGSVVGHPIAGAAIGGGLGLSVGVVFGAQFKRSAFRSSRASGSSRLEPHDARQTKSSPGRQDSHIMSASHYHGGASE